MKTLLTAGLLLAGGEGEPDAASIERAPTPAQIHVQSALRSIEAHPAAHQHYSSLAMGLARRARETANPAFYGRAQEAVQVSLALAPDNFSAQKARTWILLGQHRFADALELATELNRKMPDDVQVYGFLVDAHVELGNFQAAEDACQWMLDLRPGNVPGLTRAAYLRELFGDVEGALDLMGKSFHRVPRSEAEDRAWILTQLAHLNRSIGRTELAAQLLEKALQLFPDYHYAIGELARVRVAQGQTDLAIELCRRHYDVAPHPENLFRLAVALERAGNGEEAAALFAKFEEQAIGESDEPDNANRELISYYIDYVEDGAPEALRIARIEMKRRGDPFTRDAYAWALFANGDFDAARSALQPVLDLGLRDAGVAYHGGAILAKAGDRSRAAALLRDSLRYEPGSEYAADARRLLEHVESRKETQFDHRDPGGNENQGRK